MKIVKNRVAQVAIEVLVIMGILVIGSIVLGMTYVSSHNKTIKTSDDVTKVQEESLEELKYKEGFNPAHPAVCGNGMCEADENDISCPEDCQEPVPPIVPGPCLSLFMPTINPGDGTYTIGNTPITMSDSTIDQNCTNRQIRYSINGGVEILYTNPISWDSLIGDAPEITIKAKTYATDAETGDPKESSSIQKTYTLQIPYCYEDISRGDGTLASPKEICKKEDLDDIRNKLDQSIYYILGTDLDFSGGNLDSIGTKDKPFTGSFDGNGHKISNLKINGTDYVGLFGYTGNTAIIKNLFLVNIRIDSSNNYVGSLIGYNRGGAIENCSATGDILATNYVGGLIGYSSAGKVSNSYSNVSVTGNEKIGGFIGYSDSAEIKNCFSRGKVLGNNDTAGFIGYVNKGKVQFIYSTGEIGRNSLGPLLKKAGLIMTNTLGEIKNGFWDKETSKQLQSDSLLDEWGLTTNKMKDKETYVGWDFLTIWDIDGNPLDPINDGYPYLKKNNN